MLDELFPDEEEKQRRISRAASCSSVTSTDDNEDAIRIGVYTAKVRREKIKRYKQKQKRQSVKTAFREIKHRLNGSSLKVRLSANMKTKETNQDE